MRILVVSDTPFAPPTAGNRRRIHDMLAFLRGRGVEVGMLLLSAPDRAEWDVPAMRARLDRLEIAEIARPSGRVEKAMRRVLPDLPLRLDAWCPPTFRACAARLVAHWSPDVVLVQYVFLSACIPGLGTASRRPPLTVIDTHDLMHRRRAAYAGAGLSTQWFHTTRSAERRGLARADVLLAIQEEDAGVLREMVPGRTVLTVPHAQPVTPAPREASNPSRLLVVASYNELNVVGLRWVLEHVWPRLRTLVPDAELVVCGNIVEKVPERFPGVAFRGVVPSLAHEYAASRVVLVPVPSGTGLKVKLVEALCHARPVVTTSAGAAGVETGDPAGIVVADDPDAFAKGIYRLLSDPITWDVFVDAAEAHARRRFTPEAVFRPFVELLEQRIAVATPAAPDRP